MSKKLDTYFKDLSQEQEDFVETIDEARLKLEKDLWKEFAGPKNIPVFVYGTLKKGEDNEDCVRDLPKQDGYIFAELWTLISYPYILHGEDKVYGELYYIDKDVALNIHYMETQEKAWAPEEVLFYPNTGENPKQVITYFGTTRLLELIEQNKHAHFKCSKNSWTKSNSGLTEEECKQYSLYYEE